MLDEIARFLKPGGTFIASISHRPSRIKVDGEELHPTVQPEEWWMAKLVRFGEVRRKGRYLCALASWSPPPVALRKYEG